MTAAASIRDLQQWIRWCVRAALIAAVVLVLSVLPYRLVGGTGSEKLSAMRGELARVQRETEKAQADVTARRLRVDALKNDTRTVETIARHELHMLYPHEKTLRLSDSSHHDSEKSQ